MSEITRCATKRMKKLTTETFAYEAPESEIEEKIANLWREVLSIDNISRRDNFFALGGDSLLAIELVIKLKEIGLNITLRQVFDAPTLNMLTLTLKQHKPKGIPPNLIMQDTTEIKPKMLPLITLSQADIDTIVAQTPGGVANIQDIYGLTPLQNGMLYHQRMTKEGDPYLIVSQLRFIDHTSLERYAYALQMVIERHDIFRTAIFWDGLNEPAQVVVRQVSSILSELTVNEPDKPVLPQLGQQFNPQNYRFKLTKAPLLRLTAAPEPEGSWVAFQLMHHLILDQSALERLQTEIHAIMDEKFEELLIPTPFRHFVAQTQSGINPAENTQFFTEMLGDIDEPTLPFGLCNVDTDECVTNDKHLNLPLILYDHLRMHARNLNVNLASICHLAWAQVLAATSGREAVVFGTMLLLQTRNRNNTIMGPMSNALPIRLNVDDRSIETAVRNTHVWLRALLAHVHTQLELAQRCSGFPADLPLFNALLDYRHNQKKGEVNKLFPGVTFADSMVRATYPLNMRVHDNDSSLCLSAQVVSSISATRICAYMRQALESVVDALAHTPQLSIRKLRVIPPEEQTLLLHTWTQTTELFSPLYCLDQLFEVQVKCCGQAIAVECQGQALNYLELNADANRLAHYLIAQNVKPDDRIAICIERSIPMIVGILAIIKAGCAYVPLDPNYPSQRLRHILLDADPVFLLADASGRNALGEHKVPLIELGKPLSFDLPIDNPDKSKLGLTPIHLAYVIYTSGSTGTPKGVMVEHQQIVRLFEVTHDKYDFSKRDKWCLFHSISFDISVWELWGAFRYGSQLSIVSKNTIRSVNEFYDWICTNYITILCQTSSAFKTIMRAIHFHSRLDHLRYIIFVGEELDPSIAKEWFKKYNKNGTILNNMYGPTETTVYAAFQRIEILKDVYSIGRPLPDFSVYLLNPCGEPVPIGAEGEMYISGAGVARGYLNSSELTAERFLPNPFSEKSVARMYRTGDRARYLPDRKIVFLGRMDHQLKIRGFRIEPGEIESRLVEHPLVYDAVVQMYNTAIEAHLVAYVVANFEAPLANKLRAYLLTLLPDYMVPTAYVCLPSLPLTPNGKLNRSALPAPDYKAFARQLYEAPQDEIEEKLANIWSDLLNIERISRHDNFFALGGHSLLIVRLLAQLREIGLDVSVNEVFEAHNLAILASKLVRYHAVTVPANMITTDTTEITPEMLPLINLSQADINAMIAQIPDGIANIQDIYGLTPLQNGILYHHLMATEGDPYLIVKRLRFIDRTSLERYANVMQTVIERHDILRTAIFWDGLSEPAQAVLRQIPSLLTEITVKECDKPVLEQLSEKFNPHCFRLDLTRAPLLRLLIATEFDGSWAAMQLMHHSIIDHSTMERLQAEIHAIMGGKIEIVTPVIPFRNFVAQIRIGMSSSEHMRFFTETLGDFDEPVLPFGLSDVNQGGSEINEAHLKLSRTLNYQLRANARKLHVSLASICHLSWAQVLAKASEREVVVFGTVLLGRLQTGEGNNIIMGPMINTLPIRLNIDEKNVESAVCDAHARLSALLTHEHTPLVLAQHCSGVPASVPLFSTLLNYRYNQDTGEDNMLLPGVTVLDEMERTNYPLTLSVDDEDSTLCLTSQVMSPISAARICDYVQQFLESLAEALAYTPQQSVQTLGVMPLKERTLLLHSWNQTKVIHSHIFYLHQLFETQVDCDGQVIALECKEQTMTYSELNIQANHLAHYLIVQGVQPDDRIALCVERSTTTIVGILGILKAGCAYVPLDPAYSSQRLTHILLDSKPTFLLADKTGRDVLGNHEVPIIKFERPLPYGLSFDNPDVAKLELTPAHLAYIIYTSGSTGAPKGLMVEHRHVTNCISWIINTFKAEDFEHTAFTTSVNFDMSLYECFGSLSLGKTLHITPNVLGLSESKIFMLCTVPSAVTTILNADSLPISLHTLHLAGEPLKASLIKRIFKLTKVTELCNLYGQTETSLFSTIHRFKPGDKIIETVGRPIANTQIYLLDTKGELVLLGVAGEIYIGGANVARGYLNRPDLTAERFLLDPFSAITEARMYRTGDLARYLPDGNLVFLGRVDQQVKIRGFRIELGEIETRLVEHPDVEEATVQCYYNGSDAHLVAYVVADTNASVINDWRNYLSKLLPNYMIPTAYVCLPSFPLTPNGKLDRQALPAPDDNAFARQQYEAPQGEMEEKLAQIWCELLTVDQISRHDNFFALGGHSLLVVRMLAQLRHKGLNTTAREVFEAPTLAMLALKLTCYKALTIPPNVIRKDSTQISPEMLPLITLSQADIDAIIAQVPGGVANIQDIYGLSSLQKGMLFHHLMAEKGDAYLNVFQLSFLCPQSLEQYAYALQMVIERHDILRTAIFWDSLNEPAQVVVRQVSSILSKINVYEFDKPVLEQLNEKFNPHYFRLDLTKAPLLRLMAAPASEGSWVALQLMHHSIFDNLTLGRLREEIYAIMDGKFERLMTPTPFRYYVAQTRLATSSIEHTRYFTEMLNDIVEPTVPFTPYDIGQERSKLNEAHLKLSDSFNDQLRKHARNLLVSLSSICHLAWAQVLAKAVGRQKVVFGTMLLGRLQNGDENNTIMGPMINTLPMRLNIDERSVETAIRDTHTRLSELLAHEHAPLVLAQRCSGILSGLPLFSALLNYRHNKKSGELNTLVHGVRFVDSTGETNYPLVMSVDDNDSSLYLSVQVVPPISATQVCAYMQQSLESLVDAITNATQQPFQNLRVMPPDERNVLLHSWNQTTVVHSPACCLHQLFEAHVESDGEVVAVECERQILNYSELNAEANRVANYLIARNVKPDDRIALCVERSTTMIVGILGILKAGCTYVPLDPAHSIQRLTNILLDADPIFLLADVTGRNSLGNYQISVIELQKPLHSDLPIENPDITQLRLTPTSLAYITYIYGSTGEPKGVMVEHQQVIRTLEVAENMFDFNKQDKWCLFHSISFNVSDWEIWGALLHSSQLSIASRNLIRSKEEFYEWISINGITVLNQTALAFKTLMKVVDISSRIDRLRYVFIADEESNPLIAINWREKYGKSKAMLVYMYSPTEATLCAISQQLKTSENAYIVIQPLRDYCVYLLDPLGKPVLLGVEGEIYTSGARVARGYLNRPELTAKHFLPDPFHIDPSTRMCRTGDLARYLPDGNLVFLGRMDQQVKFRGFRIEPGEIEARLLEHPQVYGAAVQSYGDGSDARLIAYVIADADTSLSQNLRTYLSLLLPDYMIPTAYVRLQSLPLTSSGKLDQRALPAPDYEVFTCQQYEAPQNEIEEKVVNIWSELLNIDRISRHDNFFELGGHSLLVMHFVNKAKLYNLRIDIRSAFSFPILKHLAEQIKKKSKRFDSDVAIPAR